MRLDIFLVEKGLAETRTKAKNLIELGQVTVNNKQVDKPSFSINGEEKINIHQSYKSSLGSIKLQKAIDEFKPQIFQKTCLDLGASNGGFTHILLENGAKTVYALDIGECALQEEIQNDPRVIVKDRTNARYISKSNFSEKIDFITGDLSFISLKLILPVVYEILEHGAGIFLIKPQFETEKKFLPKSGIIHDRKMREKIVTDIVEFSKNLGFKILGIIEAPHPFINKNQEYLLYVSK